MRLVVAHGDRLREARVLARLGILARRRRDHDAARHRWVRAMNPYAALGHEDVVRGIRKRLVGLRRRRR
ncbi:hypothetical protein [Saccharothrix lopnurensis]|uniref:Uncharacterized protein n=1 Tax=Saccharothrix lopnurensis TaxID=1670621 RepID=A0ABW1PDM3_9PSEU